ncbi:MAG: hypothetical protein HN704_10725 [Bacteroidetes bacterium]|nr:hypothetical protein [Bacteroidota bacterium]MBT6688068.1 hypothetical protein [Bacteroidota bacterium]MBT7145020.1 hypothetical protein [Bacteroidota bacterium]MBT7492066.1 hypothetical protein [Bacteroidota bacterium]
MIGNSTNKTVLKIVIFITIISFLDSCTSQIGKKSEIQEVVKYIHISHTRTDSNPNIDKQVEQICFSNFDMRWLGGDMAYLSSDDTETMNRLDSVFDLSSLNTLWALGNHDYTDLQLIEFYTNRNKFYSYFKNGISFLIIDTQDSLSNICGSQKSMFDNLLDTIQKSTHLIILHHKLIWMYDNPLLEPKIGSVSNGNFGDCFYCVNPNNFYIDIYPKLKEIKQRGIEVICIAGDIGFKAKEFEYLTPEGIFFLASGIKFNSENNKAIIFEHDIKYGILSWEFKLMSNIL